MIIPFNDLSRQFHAIQKDIEETLRTVMSRGTFILGDEVRDFEREYADFLEISHAVGVGSGTDALTLAIRALGIGNGDEVIVPANTYPSVFGILNAGVTVRLVDVMDDGLIDPEKIGNAITDHTKAVIPVHLYGSPVDVNRIQDVLKRFPRQISVIEDCAQAHGAEYRDNSSRTWKKAGTWGEAGCFSFYPTKNLGAYGDGGMVVTRDESVQERVKKLRMYGEDRRYHSTELSGVSRLDELQAAILRVKLKHLSVWTKRRRGIAAMYRSHLTGVGDIRFVNGNSDQWSEEDTNSPARSVFHLFVIRTGKREELVTYLGKKGIGTSVHYPVPIHLTPACRSLGYKPGDFPEAERQSQEILSLPMFPELTDGEVETVIDAVRSFFHI